MTKYTSYYKKPRTPIKERLLPHPIWRGIGLILAIVLPVMSYFLTNYLLQHKGVYLWFVVPNELVFQNLQDPYLLIKILYTLLITFVLFVVISLVTFMINSLFGNRR